MDTLQNIALMISNFFIPFLIGSLIFFSLIVAPNTFANLDHKSSRKFIRSIFPKLYLWSLLISIILTVSLIIIDLFLGFILLFISFGFFFSRQYLMKWINTISDVKEKNELQKKKFNQLHTLSVVIFLTQVILLIITYYHF